MQLRFQSSPFSLLLATLSVLAVSGCGDPVPAATKDSLGGEAPGERTGPTHRRGQPCGVCHDGGTAPAFAVAGTLFVTQSGTEPLVGATVTVVDANGATFHLQSNCAGNFYANTSEVTFAYPLHVSITSGSTTVAMKSLVHRDNSCASCHTNPPGPASAGHIYFDNNLPSSSAVFRCN